MININHKYRLPFGMIFTNLGFKLDSDHNLNSKYFRINKNVYIISLNQKIQNLFNTIYIIYITFQYIVI